MGDWYDKPQSNKHDLKEEKSPSQYSGDVLMV